MCKIKRFAGFVLTFALLLYFVAFSSEIKVHALNADRIVGNDRYKTAIEISKRGWQESQNVVLATGESFPDALCAAPLAKQLNAPILLTTKGAVSNELLVELDRLKAKNIFIIGGKGVVSQNIEDSLKQKGLSVTRLFGNDRYETSMAVANYMASHFAVSREIVAATGKDFPDALSAAPIAASKGMPIILVPDQQLPAAVKTYTIQKGVTKTYIVGGNGVISDKVKEQLPNPERIYGDDRYETNVAILNRFNNDLNFDRVYMATGNNFPDALSGSAIATKTQSPIVLTGKSLAPVTKNYIAFKLDNIGLLTALGGEGVVPSHIVETIKGYLRGSSPGNTVNLGFTNEEKGYVYYNNGAFYKAKTDGAEKTLISNDDPMFLNIVGDWIYYFNGNDQGRLYKMKADGTGRIKLSDDMASYINVAGDWVYYSNESEFGSLYKIRTDGTGRAFLSGDSSYDINVVGDWIYYANASRGRKIYKIKTDGTAMEQIGEDSAEFINVIDGWIYYSNLIDGGKIYKIKTDGTSRIKVNDSPAYSINVSDGWIYYSNLTDEGKIYKVRIDGTENSRLTNDGAMNINTAGDWIYYISGTDESLYKVKADGSMKQKVQ